VTNLILKNPDFNRLSIISNYMAWLADANLKLFS